MTTEGPIFLTGFMATGKTAVGRELARLTGRRLIDTDTEIVRRAGRSVAEIFAKLGEDRFRDLEREVLREACDGGVVVVATGGGAVLDPDNRRRMRAAGTVVCLAADAQSVLERVGGGSDRPLLAGVVDRRRRIEELLDERCGAYADADWTEDTTGCSPGEVARRILERLEGMA